MNDTRVFGWPFLLARGRRRGHGVLLAPDFLVRAGEHGILETVSVPTGAQVITAAGRRLTIGAATHLVTAEDTAEPGGPTELRCLPRDEHGRPLRLIYGIVQDAPGVEVPAADLRTARMAALDTYRRFLRVEDVFEILPSQAFPLSGRLLVQPSTKDPIHRPRGRAAAVAAGVSAVAALLAVLWLRSGDDRPPQVPPPPPPCVTSTPAPPSYSAQGDGGAPSGPVAQPASTGSSVSSNARVCPSRKAE